MARENETTGIRAALIIDVIGRPPEHLTETLNKIADKIEKEKGVKIIEKRFGDPRELEKEKGFFTNFLDIEVEVEEIQHLIVLMFNYMPAHVEVISPELIALTNNGWGDMLTGLTQRLHGYDEMTRVTQVEKSILEKKLREVMEKKEDTLKGIPKGHKTSEKKKD